MKRNNFFVKIWLVHLFVYYLTASVIVKGNLLDNPLSSKKMLEIIQLVLISPFFGIMGFLEDIPFFILLPISIMLALIFTKFKKRWFLSYSLSLFISYFIDYLYLFYNHKQTKVLFDDGYNILFVVIPCLIVSISVNWFLFKDKYKNIIIDNDYTKK
ncbi:hypothetical protein [Flavobacterium sp. KMS]|uniref:hypothetical protein n=2 Tax=unclassified Flavobacterium TaxID=196869 RepID=UPI000A827EAB|nr:hypothetical protein [Flavobacterium sp. KMS]